MSVGMSKRVRDVRALAESEGCVVDRIDVGTHIKVHVRRPGRDHTHMVVAGGSPSDRRAWLATRSMFRRVARGGEP